MKLQKRLLLVFILSLTAIILVACSLFPPKVSSPTVGDVPPITASDSVPKTPHATVGAFENCITCHAAAELRHTMWDTDYCLSCHPSAADEGGDISISTITLPGNHDSAAFANCAMCHAGGLDSIPHQLDGNYADCASCHTVEYESAPDGEEPTEGDAPASGPGAISLPGSHNSAAFANCAACHAAGTDVAKNIPHALDGMYADCQTCHTVNYQAAPAPAPADPTPAPTPAPAPADPTPAPADPTPAPVKSPITLPGDHNAAMYANCSMCHAAGLDSVPHALDGAYASCADCHTVNYK